MRFRFAGGFDDVCTLGGDGVTGGVLGETLEGRG
jgi:hypothetical protein